MTDGGSLRGVSLRRSFGTGVGRVDVLTGLDIAVEPGALTVVTGRSGAGKTTLVNILGGLDRPDSGRVLLGDEVLSEAPRERLLELRRTRIGMVFQDFGLIPVLTAAENIEVPLRLAREEPRRRDARVAELLERMGLSRHARHLPSQLSGGQQQRVGIARALAAAPTVVLADEPTAQLDQETAASVLDLLVDLTRERGLATLVTTHDPLVVARADQVIHLHH
ncbi:ABC transporter [Tessaracoccus lapidicaptus]|uniref:ABC transporter n=1 Tax=Tessaracoccus lapidicaptus TaxID=1427523 RepID=A0A1C0AK98_9ACTN|nr:MULTISPECIES: ABC transporter ATP-binding protein [Tessaracoccus]AQX16896.1 ABC transporter [Tessaracoccus sp. T2.5-30]OCL33042.1 ABC transporter [Tessaracoccus lapidicaptus]VEP41688.1 ABC transporter ATP-binding protein YtrE [Tessaracoccus lapidicaptus]